MFRRLQMLHCVVLHLQLEHLHLEGDKEVESWGGGLGEGTNTTIINCYGKLDMAAFIET